MKSELSRESLDLSPRRIIYDKSQKGVKVLYSWKILSSLAMAYHITEIFFGCKKSIENSIDYFH